MALKASDKEYIENLSIQVTSGTPLINGTDKRRTVRVYSVAFDGTFNDRSRVDKSDRETIVAHISGLINAKYYPGAGMQGKWRNPVDAATGQSSEQLARRALEEFYRQAEKWLQADPKTEIRIFVTGFSRGAATARHFMNLVDHTWSEKFKNVGAPDSENSPRIYSILYDTVATGQSDSLMLNLPSSVDYLVHFVAYDETRGLFEPIIDNDPNFLLKPINFRGNSVARTYKSDRITLVFLPGAHSDIGSSYRQGIGGYYISLTEELLYEMGLININSWDISSDVFNAGMHDSRGVLDQLLGKPAPDEILVSRRYQPILSSFMTADERNRLRSRMQNLVLLSVEERPSTWRHEETTSSLTFRVKKTKDSLEILPPYDKAVDPNSLHFCHDSAGYKRLTYRLIGSHDLSTFILNRTMWSMLREEKESDISISPLYVYGEKSIVFYVDNIQVGGF